MLKYQDDYTVARARIIEQRKHSVQNGFYVCLSVILSIFALSSCVQFDTDKVSSMNLSDKDKDFNYYLTLGYKNLSDEEMAKGQQLDAEHFASKAVFSINGGEPMPNLPTKWYIADNYIPTLLYARDTMLSLIDDRIKDEAPKAAAASYFLYDCWIEELEHAISIDEQDSCRTALFDNLNNLAELRESLGIIDDYKADETDDKEIKYAESESFKEFAHKAPERVKEVIKFYKYPTVYFDNGSARVANVYKRDLAEFAAIVKDLDDNIILNGHADLMGKSTNKNILIGMKRAISVADQLNNAGISKDRIKIFSYGDTGSKYNKDSLSDNPNRRIVEVLLR